MKLTKIALSLVAVFAVAEIGGAWYTGSQLESQQDKLTAIANQGIEQIASNYGVDAAIKDIKVERNFFTSDVTYTLSTNVQGETKSFDGKAKVYHGPFPLNRLLKGQLMPKMASAETDETALPLFDYFINSGENKATVAVKTDFPYSGGANGTIKTKHIETKDHSILVPEMETEFELDKNGEGEYSSSIPKMTLADKTQGLTFVVEDIEAKVDATPSEKYKNLAERESKLEIKSLTLTSQDATAPTIIFKDIKAEGDESLKDHRFLSEGKFDSKLILKSADKSVDLGDFTMSFDSNLDAESSNILGSSLQGFDSENNLTEKQKAAFINVLSKQGQIHLNTVSLKNSKGENDLALKLNFNQFDPDLLTSTQEILNIFKESKLDFKMNTNSLEELFTQINVLKQGLSESEANAQAKQEIQALVQQVQYSQTAQLDGDTIKMKLEIDQGKVKLNDQEIPNKDVENAMLMLIFGMGSMGY